MPYVTYSPTDTFTKAMFDFDSYGWENFKFSGTILVSVSDGFTNVDVAAGTVNSTDFTMSPYSAEISWSTATIANIQATLSILANFANLAFSNITDYDYTASSSIASPANVGLLSDINICFMNADSSNFLGISGGANDGVLGYAGSRGDVLINCTGSAFTAEGLTFADSTKSRQVLMHELLHSLGLSHPFDLVGKVKPDYAALLTAGFDKLGFSVRNANSINKEYFSLMSYDDESQVSFINAYTPMIFDVIALQRAYGAGLGTSGAGNDLITAGWVGYRTYFDLGGTDTVDASNYADGAYLNLGTDIVGADHLVGVLMSLQDGISAAKGGDPKNLRWLYGEFENAIGSSLSDLIVGNGLANVLDGGGGADTLVGGAGDDSLTGGDGIDTASYADSAAAVVVNLAMTGAQDTGGAGTDLLATIENLIGSGFADILDGGATANLIDGGAGNDTLTGGAGDDVFKIGSGIDAVTDLGAADVVTVAAGATLNATVTAAWTATAATSNAGVTNLTTSGQAVNLTAATGTVGYTVTNNGDGATLTGSAFADSLSGGTGNDSLVGGAGNDSQTGGAGNDSLTGGAGNDSLSGGDGTDYVIYEAARSAFAISFNQTNTVFTVSSTGTGTDIVSGMEFFRFSDGDVVTTTLMIPSLTSGNDAWTGTATDEAIRGEAGNDTLIGSAGNDTLDGGTGNDVLTGGDGIDTATYATATAAITVSLALTTAQNTAGAGTDTLTTIENLIGSGFGDSFVGGTTANQIDGGAGNDKITGAGGADTLLGGEGNDVFVIGSIAEFAAGEVITGGAGTDEVRFASTIASTLTLTANVTVERLVIGTGTAGAAVSSGTKALSVNAGAMAGAVSMTGNAGSNALTGGAGNDTLDGLTGNDNLTGGAGTDTFIVSAGTDTISDLNGVEVLTVASAATANAKVTAAWTATSDSANRGAANLTSAGFAVDLSAITTGTAGFKVTNTGAAATFAGSSLADALTGGSGNDSLNGGAGNDTITGGAGADSMLGGDGNDLFIVGTVADFATDEVITGGIGTDELRFTSTTASTLTLTSGVTVERVVIGTGTAALAVSSATTALNVNASAVTNGLTITGNAGVNTLTGSGYNDSIDGGAGHDSLVGGGGADTLLGGLGNDTLTGGIGADVFVFNTAPNASSNKDTITDFAAAEDDIWLAKAVMAGLGSTTGALAAAAFWGGDGITASHDSSDRILYNKTTGALFYDADGTGSTAAIQIAQLTAGVTLTAADVFII